MVKRGAGPLIIRDEQMQFFETRKRDRFVERAADRLEETWPAFRRKPKRKVLEHHIQRALTTTRRFGIRAERDVMRFLLVMVALGPNFAYEPQFPWALELLRDGTLSGSLKMDLLTERVAEHLRDED